MRNKLKHNILKKYEKLATDIKYIFTRKFWEWNWINVISHFIILATSVVLIGVNIWLYKHDIWFKLFSGLI